MIIIPTSERILCTKIKKAWLKLRNYNLLGSQYDWLACFALQHKGIELSIHIDDKAVEVIEKYGSLIKISDPIIGDYWIVDKCNSKSELLLLFQNYHLPLVKYTKLEMEEYYIANGYERVMNQTWFCYNPIHGKPCGCCNPCMHTIDEGMKWRFTKSALIRYRLKK